jgi:VWFA-related protein
MFKLCLATRTLPALLFLPLLSAVAASGQLAPSPDAPPVSHAPAQQPDEESVATFKLTTTLVDVVFNVKDKQGQLVPHLTKSDCTVLEDKVPQTWKSFNAENNLPLTLGILLDTSGSQTRVLPLEQEAGSEFLQEVMRQKDQAFALSVDVNVDVLQDLTNSPRLLARALNKAEINAPGSIGPGPVPTSGDPRGTVLYDAIYLASNEKMREETGRKALILLTDGQDEGSRHKIKDAIAAAQKSNVVIYVILIADVQEYMMQGMGYYGFSAMKEVTEATGGRVINVGHNSKKLEEAFQQIQDELRSQYVGTYTPTNTKLDGTFRHLSVECKADGMKTQVRKGYYATNAEADADSK